jgi:hypothetical protein
MLILLFFVFGFHYDAIVFGRYLQLFRLEVAHVHVDGEFLICVHHLQN